MPIQDRLYVITSCAVALCLRVGVCLRFCGSATHRSKLVDCLPNYIVHLVRGSWSVAVIVAVKQMPWHIARSEWPAWLMQRRFAANPDMRPSSRECFSNERLLKR